MPVNHSRQQLRQTALCGVLGAVCLAGGSATPIVTEVDKLTSPNPSPFAYFGRYLSMSSDTIVIGGYVFERDVGGVEGWTQTSGLTPSDSPGGNGFAQSVSVSGSTIIVGAQYDDDAASSAGAVYVYERSTRDEWVEVAKLTASDAATNDYLGVSVAVSGNTVVAGAYRHDGTGAAYVYDRDTGGPGNWGEVAEIKASDGAIADNFGDAVAVSGDTIVIGAFADDDAGASSGSAYVYVRNAGGPNAWGEVAKLTAVQADQGDWFGRAVAIHGDTIVVGAAREDDGGVYSGAAHVYQRNSGGPNRWGEVARLTASDAAPLDGFGQSVSISGTTIAVGSPGDFDGGIYLSGSTYVFDWLGGESPGWVEVAKLRASDAEAEDRLGITVSTFRDTIIAGAIGDGDGGTNSGSVYVFDIGPVCGDGVVELPEQCDDGNTVDGDGCSGDCEACVDEDGDGFGLFVSDFCPGGVLTDCDDFDPATRPGATEVCDGKDNDCDFVIDEDTPGAERERFTFDAVPVGGNPDGWFDTGALNGMTFDDVFQVFDVDGERVFGTTVPSNHIHSHFVGPGSETWTNYTFSGRFKIDSPDAGIGFVVLSDYPNSNTYYYMRRLSNDPELRIRTHGLEFPSCTPRDTAVDPADGSWHRFELRADVDAVRTTILAKAWREGDVPPEDWQVECVDDTAERRTFGRFGIWGYGTGGKYFDDLRVVANAGQACSSDVGECTSGIDACEGGLLVCDGVEPMQEVCDGNDNDCDGTVPADEFDLDTDEFRACNVNDVATDLVMDDADSVSWNGDPRADGWNVYVGSLEELKAMGYYTQVPGANGLAVTFCGLSSPMAALPDVADPGAAAFVLVAGVEDGVEATLGTDSQNVERPNDAACP